MGRFGVKAGLTENRGRNGRPRHPIDAATVRRMMSGFAKSVADGDPADLVELLALRAQLDGIIADTVTHMREHQEFTWQAIADAAGTTRQAAQQRWGKPKP